MSVSQNFEAKITKHENILIPCAEMDSVTDICFMMTIFLLSARSLFFLNFKWTSDLDFVIWARNLFEGLSTSFFMICVTRISFRRLVSLVGLAERGLTIVSPPTRYRNWKIKIPYSRFRATRKSSDRKHLFQDIFPSRDAVFKVLRPRPPKYEVLMKYEIRKINEVKSKKSDKTILN